MAGPGLVLFRLVWGVLLALAVVAPIAGIHYGHVENEQLYTPLRDFGLRSRQGDALLGQPFGAEARDGARSRWGNVIQV